MKTFKMLNTLRGDADKSLLTYSMEQSPS